MAGRLSCWRTQDSFPKELFTIEVLALLELPDPFEEATFE
jgi:hypothetical protein